MTMTTLATIRWMTMRVTFALRQMWQTPCRQRDLDYEASHFTSNWAMTVIGTGTVSIPTALIAVEDNLIANRGR
ncbi:hypothetical protein PE067_14040 [Paracoccus sp. DMF-8]|uniref:hypothetical protein n=1 Tax=Paracoccus sp. DMF-8 TaxID=3019445 RepID=UPI0023E76204|nr:hypothetical protein [Paracoccus sp. DMF-8]MDF3607156.1 hypothetical protein [Paracoccus sp. DMF-8]